MNICVSARLETKTKYYPSYTKGINAHLSRYL